MVEGDVFNQNYTTPKASSRAHDQIQQQDEANTEMANINIRIDDNVKDEVHAYFSSIGIKPSDAIRGFYEYIQATRKMPFSKKYLSNEDEYLLNMVRKVITDNDELIDVKANDLRTALQL